MKKFLSLLAMLIIAIAVVGCTPRERRNEHEIEDLVPIIKLRFRLQ